MIDTANLQAFLKVADSGSFSIAAGQLFVTQPAISKRIKHLEQQLNSKLLDRHGKQFQLTQTGQALLPKARQILHDLESAQQHIADLEGSPMGSLSMATSHHIGLHRLPPILRAFIARHPEVDLDLSFMDSERACQLIALNRLEIAVVTLPLVNPDKLEFFPVWDDRLIITCAPDHPLATNPATTLGDLVQHAAVLPSYGTFTREAIELALRDIRDELIISLETNYLETIKMMVSVGLGWSILPQSMLDHSLHQLDIAHFQSSRQLGIVLNKQRSRSKAMTAMIEMINDFRDRDPVQSLS